MRLYSTKSPSTSVSLRQAVLESLPKDGGLYMPQDIPRFTDRELASLSTLSFSDLSYQIAHKLIGHSIPSPVLENIIHRATNFPVPLVQITDRISILELFHGPSLAFKDFGARFMAELMSYFNRNEDKKLTILVATSGDTGGAVAAGFLNTPGIEVIILYPSGRVSDLQEKQLTTLGGNILACEIDGSFDDCQYLVKQAFLDESLKSSFRLSSANSINIARLIPQSFYYYHGFFQSPWDEVSFSVPSGNFGNLTAGLIAKRMGLPVKHFLAATNINDVVPSYLLSGDYLPRPSVSTISNAMDVGSPSNFDRILNLYGSTWNNLKQDILGYSYTDDQTKSTITRVSKSFGYTLDPHAAIGFLAAESYQDAQTIVLETAHPAKFSHTIDPLLSSPVDIPERLSSLKVKTKVSHALPTDYVAFKDFLLSHPH